MEEFSRPVEIPWILRGVAEPSCRLSYCRDRFESRFHAALPRIIQSGREWPRQRTAFEDWKLSERRNETSGPARSAIEDSLSEWNSNLEEGTPTGFLFFRPSLLSSFVPLRSFELTFRVTATQLSQRQAGLFDSFSGTKSENSDNSRDFFYLCCLGNIFSPRSRHLSVALWRIFLALVGPVKSDVSVRLNFYRWMNTMAFFPAVEWHFAWVVRVYNYRRPGLSASSWTLKRMIYYFIRV